MIQPQTYLNVVDNNGARELMCIQIIGASNRLYAHVGEVVIVVIKEVVPNMPLKRSDRAVMVRTCKELKYDNGISSSTRFNVPSLYRAGLAYGITCLIATKSGSINVDGLIV